MTLGGRKNGLSIGVSRGSREKQTGKRDAFEVLALEEEEGMTMVSFDQKPMGHIRKKSATIITNLLNMTELHALRSPPGQDEPLAAIDVRGSQDRQGFDYEGKRIVGSTFSTRSSAVSSGLSSMCRTNGGPSDLIEGERKEKL